MGIFSTRLSEKAWTRDSELRAERYPWASKREMMPEMPIRRKITAIRMVLRVSSARAASMGPISRPTKITSPAERVSLSSF
jgi:hypothetical protein